MDEPEVSEKLALGRLVDDATAAQIKAVQGKMTARLLDSKQQLQVFNEQSRKQFAKVNMELQRKVKLLNELREDLMHVYQQLRTIQELMPEVPENSEANG